MSYCLVELLEAQSLLHQSGPVWLHAGGSRSPWDWDRSRPLELATVSAAHPAGVGHLDQRGVLELSIPPTSPWDQAPGSGDPVMAVVEPRLRLVAGQRPVQSAEQGRGGWRRDGNGGDMAPT